MAILMNSIGCGVIYDPVHVMLWSGLKCLLMVWTVCVVHTMFQMTLSSLTHTTPKVNYYTTTTTLAFIHQHTCVFPCLCRVKLWTRTAVCRGMQGHGPIRESFRERRPAHRSAPITPWWTAGWRDRSR